MASGGARPGAGRRPKSGRPKNLGRYLYVVQEIDDASASRIGVAADPYKSLAYLKRRNRRLKLVGVFRAPSNSDALLIVAKASLGPVSGEWNAETVAAQLQETARSFAIALVLEPLREPAAHGGRRPGAGRPKGVPNGARQRSTDPS
jgi:hypothetical protein